MWRIIELQVESPEMNMAIDEAIHYSVSHGLSDPTIRFYKWRPEAVSLGRNQSAEMVLEDTIRVVRRPTGGNAVYHHEDDFTYSVVAPKGMFGNSFRAAYEAICGRVIAAINAVSTLEAALVGKNDIVLDGRKVCGNAMDFTGTAFLQHGSVFTAPAEERWRSLFDLGGKELRISFLADYLRPSLGSEDFAAHLRESFSALSPDGVYSAGLSSHEQRLAEELCRTKYSTVEWNAEGLRKGTACAADIRDD